mgnify:CR=1 FL=1
MSLNNIKELIGFGKTLNILFIEDNNEVRIQIHKLLLMEMKLMKNTMIIIKRTIITMI